jgi:hypothetical protein
VIRELWDRHMDPRRALSLGLGVVAYILGVLLLAVVPGFVASGGAGPDWFAGLGLAFGGATGMAVRGYAFHRRPGTRGGLRRGILLGGLMLLGILGMFALASAIHPIVSPNPMITSEAWLGLAAIGSVVVTTANVLWERNQRRQRIAAVFLLAVCLTIAGVAGLRAGGPWTPVGIALVVVGVLAVAAAAIQGFSALLEAPADPAT